MGYNTTINLWNDTLHDVRDDPQGFVDSIMENYFHGGHAYVGNIHGGRSRVGEIARTGHADEFRLYAVHQNSLIELSPYTEDTRDLVERRPEMVLSLIDQARWLLERLEASLNNV